MNSSATLPLSGNDVAPSLPLSGNDIAPSLPLPSNDVAPLNTYRGIEFTSEIPDIVADLDAISRAPKVTNWIDGLIECNKISATQIKVKAAIFFGPKHTPERLGFLLCEIPCTNKETDENIMANIVLIRGDSITVYIRVTVRETGLSYIVFVKQMRVPGQDEKTELPAGMLDARVKANEILGPVFDEIKQETGLIPKVNELVQLGTKVHTSVGLLDEGVTGFLWETTISLEEYKVMLTKIYGEDENEKIKLHLVLESEIEAWLDKIGDAKAEFCYRRVVSLMRMRARELGR